MNDESLSFRVESRSVANTTSVGAAIAEAIEPGDVVLLVGDLGAGKTVLVKGIVEGLGGSHVTSPTFTLCHRYETSPPVAHVDCYRIDAGDDLSDLALAESIDDGCVVVIEWGERVAHLFGGDALWCEISAAGDPNDGLSRRLTIEARGATWSRRISGLRDEIVRSRVQTTSTRV